MFIPLLDGQRPRRHSGHQQKSAQVFLRLRGSKSKQFEQEQGQQKQTAENLLLLNSIILV